LQEKIKIGPDDTFGCLHDQMAELGGDLLIKTIDLIESGDFKTISQTNNEATVAPKITPDLGLIDWSKSAIAIHNHVRGLSPRPGAYTFKNGKKILVLRTRIDESGSHGAHPGEILQASSQHGLVVACGEGALRFLEIRPEARKTMSGEEYLRGYRPVIGEKFEREIDK
jgi:methionyl-tRNA formyltransferase